MTWAPVSYLSYPDGCVVRTQIGRIVSVCCADAVVVPPSRLPLLVRGTFAPSGDLGVLRLPHGAQNVAPAVMFHLAAAGVALQAW